MLRIALFCLTLYQLCTVPSGDSVIANGTSGIILGVAALVVAIIVWAIIHHDETHPFSPIGPGLLW